LAKKSKKKIVRREYSKTDVRELRAHSKARTPVDKIAKLTKRTVAPYVRKRLNSAFASVISADCEADHLTQCAARSSAVIDGRGADRPPDRIDIHVIKDRVRRPL